MTNYLAVRLDREGVAEMSCIAGVGGGVTGLANTARSGRPILALDGCVLACAKACLSQAGVQPTAHILLSEYGVKKRVHADFDRDEARDIYARHIVPAARMLAAPVTAADAVPALIRRAHEHEHSGT